MIQKEFIRLGERVINLNSIRHMEFIKKNLSVIFFLSHDEEISFKFQDEKSWARFETYMSMYTTGFDNAEEEKQGEKKKIID
jgi:hypothetical protein